MKSKTSWFSFLTYGLLTIMCYMAAPMLSDAVDNFFSDDLSLALIIVITTIFLIFSFFMAIIIHEVGHMVAGLICGYKLTSFRVLNTILIRKSDGFRLMKFKLPGTGGQCLMSPPDMVDGRYPSIIFNMGGVISGLLSSALFYYIYSVSSKPGVVLFFAIAFVSGLFLAVTNGVPSKTSMVNNDGMNALELANDPAAARAMWIQLRSNVLFSQDLRSRDLPEEWTVLPSDEEMDNALCAWLVTLSFDRMMDEGKLSEALELGQKTLEGTNALPNISKWLLKSEMIIISVILNDETYAKNLYDPDLSRFLLSMAANPTIQICQYLYALKVLKKPEKAQPFLDKYNSTKSGYPYQGEVATLDDLLTKLP